MYLAKHDSCEDGLNDQAYFDAVYKEACRLTAHVFKIYNINPRGTVVHNGVAVPTILCHYDSYKLGLGSNHSDVYPWFNKYGKTMDNVRNDVAALMTEEQEEEEMTQEQFNQMMDNYLKEQAKLPATWDQSACEWAQTTGLAVGDQTGSLMPKKLITRGEVFALLQRMGSR